MKDISPGSEGLTGRERKRDFHPKPASRQEPRALQRLASQEFPSPAEAIIGAQLLDGRDAGSPRLHALAVKSRVVGSLSCCPSAQGSTVVEPTEQVKTQRLSIWPPRQGHEGRDEVGPSRWRRHAGGSPAGSGPS
ncbi:unnamed protein product [Calypogeia fissa]